MGPDHFSFKLSTRCLQAYRAWVGSDEEEKKAQGW